jgi:hypothetical protein
MSQAAATAGLAKQSFAERRSQAEFVHEKKARSKKNRGGAHHLLLQFAANSFIINSV